MLGPAAAMVVAAPTGLDGVLVTSEVAVCPYTGDTRRANAAANITTRSNVAVESVASELTGDARRVFGTWSGP